MEVNTLYFISIYEFSNTLFCRTLNWKLQILDLTWMDKKTEIWKKLQSNKIWMTVQVVLQKLSTKWLRLKTLFWFHKWVFNQIVLQKTKVQLEKHGSNKIGQTSNNLKKVAIEQYLDDYSSNSEETINKVIKVKNFVLNS